MLIDKTKNGIPDSKLRELSTKLSDAKIRACFEGKDGNMKTRAAWSFIFSFSAGRDDYVIDSDSSLVGRKLETAATDGKSYYWNYEFLDKLTKESVMLVYAHETMHIVLSHIDRGKMDSVNPIVWNYAIDMSVHAFIADAYEKTCSDALKPLMNDMKISKLVGVNDVVAMFKAIGKGQVPDESRCLFYDQKALENGAEWAYNEMMKHAPPPVCMCGSGEGDGEGDGEDGEGGGSGSGDNGSKQDKGKGLPKGLDQHIPASGKTEDKERIKRDIINAANYAANAAKGAGNLPGALKDALAEINDPTLSVFDIVKNVVRTKAHNNGDKKNYHRYQKRPEFIYTSSSTGVMVPRHKLYRPTKKSMLCNWLCCFDTSGSMDMTDIAFGVKELKVMNDAMGVISRGWMIPVDSKVYWESATEVKDAKNDISKAQVVGRGGTVFTEFFGEWDKHYPREEIDLIICVTDGDIFENPPDPGVDVVWLLTNGDRKMPPFGRKFDLRGRFR